MMPEADRSKDRPWSQDFGEGFPWGAVLVFFLTGLFCRILALDRPHFEGDEIIYRVLVHQIGVGHGYTLHGHKILLSGLISAEQYDLPIFFHPPGGIFLFWIFSVLPGESGYWMVQLLSFALFFASLLLLSWTAFGSCRLKAVLTAALGAFSPILSHVAAHYWLDAPLLAFATAATALFFTAIKHDQLGRSLAAGLVLGYACLIKTPAFFIVPGALAFAWTCREKMFWRSFAHHAAVFVGIAFLTQLPWEIFSLIKTGHIFPGAPGKPVPSLLASNPYVYYVTAVRSPWIYFVLAPCVLWTVIPSLTLWVSQWSNQKTRESGAALLAWILAILFAYVSLGGLGYSKILRYAILITPATILLFAEVSVEFLKGFPVRGSPWPTRIVPGALIALAASGFVLEILQAVQTSLMRSDLIIPLFAGK